MASVWILDPQKSWLRFAWVPEWIQQGAFSLKAGGPPRGQQWPAAGGGRCVITVSWGCFGVQALSYIGILMLLFLAPTPGGPFGGCSDYHSNLREGGFNSCWKGGFFHFFLKPTPCRGRREGSCSSETFIPLSLLEMLNCYENFMIGDVENTGRPLVLPIGCVCIWNLYSYVPLLLGLGAWRQVSLQGALLPVPAHVTLWLVPDWFHQWSHV